jgi:hypothetical protein
LLKYLCSEEVAEIWNKNHFNFILGILIKQEDEIDGLVEVLKSRLALSIYRRFLPNEKTDFINKLVQKVKLLKDPRLTSRLFGALAMRPFTNEYLVAAINRDNFKHMPSFEAFAKVISNISIENLN